MEKEEFNLSDKINLIHSEELGCDRYTCFSQKNVKEFIKRNITLFNSTCNLRNDTEDKMRKAIIGAIKKFKEDAGRGLTDEWRKTNKL